MCRTLSIACALLLLASCGEPDAVSQINAGMTRAEVEQILEPLENEHAITAIGGTGSGYVMRKHLADGRVVVLNFRCTAGVGGTGPQDVLVAAPVVRSATPDAGAR